MSWSSKVRLLRYEIIGNVYVITVDKDKMMLCNWAYMLKLIHAPLIYQSVQILLLTLDKIFSTTIMC